MYETTEGILLRKTPYSSSSAVVSFYTRKYGQISFLVRGLGRKGGKSAMLQPLNQLELTYSYKPSKQLQSLSAMQLLNPSKSSDIHPYKAPVALFLCEILYKTLREEAPDEELYQFISRSLLEFETYEYDPDFHLIFLLKLTSFFGFQPNGTPTAPNSYFDLVDGCFVSDKNQSLHVLDPEEAEVIYKLSQKELLNEPISFTNRQRRRALRNITEYYQIHLEGMGKIKSLEVLSEIFS
jgi:DNA repair protein RecO (recombination protein O)